MTDIVDMSKTPHIEAGSGAECTQDRTRETVEAIVAEMRQRARITPTGCTSTGPIMKLLNSYADRLQSAHDAEREALRDCRELNHKMVQRRCQQDDELERAESRLLEAERDAREVWRPVAECPHYEVSTYGRVRSLDRVDSAGNRRKGVHAAPSRAERGYLSVALCAENKSFGRYVHRLVAQAFIPNPDNLPQVNHKDGDPGNNAVTNLEWVTNRGNRLHATRVLLIGVRPIYGISIADGSRIDFESIQMAGEAGFKRANIKKCLDGDRKSHRGYRWYDAAIDRAMEGEDG